MEGVRPVRPPTNLCKSQGLDDEMWAIIGDCWVIEPMKRPSASELVRRLRPKVTIDKDRPIWDWDNSFASRLRSNLLKHPLTTPAHVLRPPSPEQDGRSNGAIRDNSIYFPLDSDKGSSTDTPIIPGLPSPSFATYRMVYTGADD